MCTLRLGYIGPMLSVIIPTLNAAVPLAGTIGSLAAGLHKLAGAGIGHELLVIDGGSTDRTVEIAEAKGARVIGSERGRGQQLAQGGRAARGVWLLFLHADTRLAAGWADAFLRFAEAPGDGERAAVFRFALDDGAEAARRVEALVAWRCRRFALPYGDQGLIIGRTFYERLGGYRPLPLMEDVDIVRRIGRARLVFLETPAFTSAERYRRDGYFSRATRNLVCLGLYFMGVPPGILAKLYG